MFKKMIQFIMLFGIMLQCSLLAAQTQNYLSTSGNKLVDASGKVVYLTGVNWFGFETSLFSPHGVWARDMKSVLKQVKDLGFNCIRIPWCSQMLDPGSSVRINSFGTDPYSGVSPMNQEEATKTKPIEILDILVDWCQANNLKIILDNHSKKADGYLNEGLWYIAGYDEARWLSDWTFLANRYKGKSAVVGCDLKNEPHQSTWGNTSPSTDFNKAAERCGNAILAVNPELLILVEGVAKYNGDSYWWGGQLMGARDFPVVLSKPNKLMYSPHEYGPEVFNQTWFSDPTFPANMDAIWERHFGYLYTNNTAPLLVGEFGIRDRTSNNGAAFVWFQNFMKKIGGKYSWTFWTLNPNSGDTGGILGDDWTSVNQWKMDVLRPYQQPIIPNVINGGPVTTFTITSSAGANGTITPAGAASVAQGTSKTYTITAAAGFKIANVLVDGVSVGAVATYTFTNVAGNHTIAASFSVQTATTFTITSSAGTNGTITPLGASTINQGSSQSYTITAATGFKIANVLVDGVSVGAVATFSFSNVVANHSIAASFTAIVTGGCNLLSIYAVPRASGLPSVNTNYTHAYVVGTGGPNLSNVTSAVINWDLAQNGLWQLSFNTSNGIPAWWLDFKASVQNFAAASPAITFSGTGIANMDGKYYANMIGPDVVLVAVSGNYAIYFTKAAVAPAPCAATAAPTVAVAATASMPLAVSTSDKNVYPNPANSNGFTIVTGSANKNAVIEIINPNGAVIKSIKTNGNLAVKITVDEAMPDGIYTYRIRENTAITTSGKISIIK